MKSTLRSALLIVVLVPCLVANAADTKHTTEPHAREIKALQGSWAPTSIEINGDKLTGDRMKEAAELRLVFEDGKGSIKKGDQVLQEFTFTVDPKQHPKALDLTLLNGSGESKQYVGKKSLAIYELKGDSLKACWTLFQAERARPTGFSTTPDSNLLLATYKLDSKQ